MFNRILVPIDFSPPSDAALNYARLLAAQFGASLHLLHVIDDPSASNAFVGDSYAPLTENIRELTLKESRARLQQQLSGADRFRFHVTTDALIGVPATAIVDYALSTGADLIVMGTHGRTGVQHLLLGGVAEEVARHAPCPVFTVRSGAAAAA